MVTTTFRDFGERYDGATAALQGVNSIESQQTFQQSFYSSIEHPVFSTKNSVENPVEKSVEIQLN